MGFCSGPPMHYLSGVDKQAKPEPQPTEIINPEGESRPA
jgi:hypothetical protein